MNQIQITVGELSFSFSSKQHWINKGQSWFKNSEVSNGRGICIDAKGRICTRGEHFSRAEEDDAYPINVYQMVI